MRRCIRIDRDRGWNSNLCYSTFTSGSEIEMVCIVIEKSTVLWKMYITNFGCFDLDKIIYNYEQYKSVR